MNRKNPAWDVPDAHEIEVAELVAAAGLKVRLQPSTRAQRKARASYAKKKAVKGALDGMRALFGTEKRTTMPQDAPMGRG